MNIDLLVREFKKGIDAVPGLESVVGETIDQGTQELLRKFMGKFFHEHRDSLKEALGKAPFWEFVYRAFVAIPVPVRIFLGQLMGETVKSMKGVPLVIRYPIGMFIGNFASMAKNILSNGDLSEDDLKARIMDSWNNSSEKRDLEEKKFQTGPHRQHNIHRKGVLCGVSGDHRSIELSGLEVLENLHKAFCRDCFPNDVVTIVVETVSPDEEPEGEPPTDAGVAKTFLQQCPEHLLPGFYILYWNLVWYMYRDTDQAQERLNQVMPGGRIANFTPGREGWILGQLPPSYDGFAYSAFEGLITLARNNPQALISILPELNDASTPAQIHAALGKFVVDISTMHTPSWYAWGMDQIDRFVPVPLIRAWFVRQFTNLREGRFRDLPWLIRVLAVMMGGGSVLALGTFLVFMVVPWLAIVGGYFLHAFTFVGTMAVPAIIGFSGPAWLHALLLTVSASGAVLVFLGRLIARLQDDVISMLGGFIPNPNWLTFPATAMKDLLVKVGVSDLEPLQRWAQQSAEDRRRVFSLLEKERERNPHAKPPHPRLVGIAVRANVVSLVILLINLAGFPAMHGFSSVVRFAGWLYTTSGVVLGLCAELLTMLGPKVNDKDVYGTMAYAASRAVSRTMTLVILGTVATTGILAVWQTRQMVVVAVPTATASACVITQADYDRLCVHALKKVGRCACDVVK